MEIDDYSGSFRIVTLTTAILLLAGFYVGWNLGANDAANCIGAPVGSGIISFRKAAMLMAIFAFAGAVLQGQHVMKTIGKGIVLSDPMSYASGSDVKALEKLHAILENSTLLTVEERSELERKEKELQTRIDREIEKSKPADLEDYFPAGTLPDLGIFIALLSAGFFVSLATFMSIPVSTSQAIVGGVLGVGIGIVGFRGEFFQFDVLYRIFGSWVICPVLTMILAFLIFVGLHLILGRIKSGKNMSKVIGYLVVVSSCYVSYSLGMDNVGNAVGPLLGKYPDMGLYLAAFCGVALGLGAITFGKRVSDTVGKGITPLDPAGALAAQVAAASGLYFFGMMGIPVSSSQSIVGAVIGVGLVKGVRSISKRKIAEIAIGWVAIPFMVAIFAVIAYKLTEMIL